MCSVERTRANSKIRDRGWMKMSIQGHMLTRGPLRTISKTSHFLFLFPVLAIELRTLHFQGRPRATEPNPWPKTTLFSSCAPLGCPFWIPQAAEGAGLGSPHKLWQEISATALCASCYQLPKRWCHLSFCQQERKRVLGRRCANHRQSNLHFFLITSWSQEAWCLQ